MRHAHHAQHLACLHQAACLGHVGAVGGNAHVGGGVEATQVVAAARRAAEVNHRHGHLPHHLIGVDEGVEQRVEQRHEDEEDEDADVEFLKKTVFHDNGKAEGVQGT